MRRIILALIVFTLAVQISGYAQNPDQAQVEKGRQVVAQTCAACHTTITRMIQIHKHTPEEWKETVYYMISRGAQIMPDEIEPVVAFLAANGGKGAPAGGQIAAGGRGGAGAGRGAGGGRGGDVQAGEADGQTIFQRNCQQCHELATASKKQPTEEWSAVVARMVAYGARVGSADQTKLVQYLSGLK
jgi:cytochrome c2